MHLNQLDNTPYYFKKLKEKPYGMSEMSKPHLKLEKKYRKIAKEMEMILDYIPGITFYKDMKNKFIRVNKAIADALYIIDQETGKIHDVNKAAEEMYGYSRKEWLQMKNTDVSAEPDKIKKTTYKLPLQIPIRYHKKKDGTNFPIKMMVSSYTLYNQRLIIAIGRDITERRKSEEELMKYHNHLEELVEERTKALIILISQKLNHCTDIEDSLFKIKDICKTDLIIPRYKGLSAIFIIGSSGHIFFSKINKDKTKLIQYEIPISGFISALLSFYREIISHRPERKLKQINFGNQNFYMNLKKKAIFAYLVELQRIPEMIKRYLPIVADEFIYRFKDRINSNDFNGEVSQFHEFESVIDQYFIM